MSALNIRHPDRLLSDPRFKCWSYYLHVLYRLSLANHNEQLLERLICILKRKSIDPWYSTDDAYGAKLWDIIPTINIAGIGIYRDPYPPIQVPPTITHDQTVEDDIVIVDGCRAATIHWDGFRPVAHAKNVSWNRIVMRFMLRLNLVPLIAGIACAVDKGPKTKIAGIVLLIYSSIVVLLSPILVIQLYKGKLWNTHPWLFGFEGYSDIKKIEKRIFGAAFNRLRWSHAGSPLSEFTVDNDGFIRTLDPCGNTKTKKKVQIAAASPPGEMKVSCACRQVSLIQQPRC